MAELKERTTVLEKRLTKEKADIQQALRTKNRPKARRHLK